MGRSVEIHWKRGKRLTIGRTYHKTVLEKQALKLLEVKRESSKFKFLVEKKAAFDPRSWSVPSELGGRIFCREGGERVEQGVRIVEKMKEKMAWGADNWELVKESEPERNCWEVLSTPYLTAGRCYQPPYWVVDFIQSSLNFPWEGRRWIIYISSQAPNLV